MRFHAEVAGSDGLRFSDHCHYYDSGSESLRAMVDVASGNADRLDDAGPLAEGRHQPHVSTPDDVDTPFGPVPIPHLDVVKKKRGVMMANDAVLIGSPGTDLARSAADFHLDGVPLCVGAASTDPVSWLGTPGSGATNWLNEELGSPFGPLAGLGTDPAGDAFGSMRFHAEVAGSDGLSFSDHSHYYDSGSESLRAMVDVASGNADRLGDAGTLAEGRHQPHVSTPDHVDTPFGPVPIPHLDVDVPGSPAIIDREADRPGSSVTTDHSYSPTN